MVTYSCASPKTEGDNMSEEKIVFIGKKPIREYVLVVLTELNSEDTREVTIKARGKLMAKAIDIAEIIKNRFSEGQNIVIENMKSETETLPSKEGRSKKVSSLEITMKKNH